MAKKQKTLSDFLPNTKRERLVLIQVKVPVSMKEEVIKRLNERELTLTSLVHAGFKKFLDETDTN